MGTYYMCHHHGYEGKEPCHDCRRETETVKQIRFDTLIKWLKDIRCGEYNFEILSKGEDLFLLARYDEADVHTGVVEEQTTRKWIISPHATHSEFVQTAFKCALTSMEHRTREMFRYKGAQVYGPHIDVDALLSICDLTEVRSQLINQPDGSLTTEINYERRKE